MLLLWRRGKLFDEQFCTAVTKRIQDRTTAQWIILMFRKSNRLPINPQEEQEIIKKEYPIPDTDSPLACKLAEAYTSSELVGCEPSMQQHLMTVAPKE